MDEPNVLPQAATPRPGSVRPPPPRANQRRSGSAHRSRPPGTGPRPGRSSPSNTVRARATRAPSATTRTRTSSHRARRGRWAPPTRRSRAGTPRSRLGGRAPGSGMARTFPSRVTRTVSVTASPASTGITVKIRLDRQLPDNAAERLRTTRRQTGPRRWRAGWRAPPSPLWTSRRATGRRSRRMDPDAARAPEPRHPQGSSVRSPEPVGIKATRRMIAVVYCWPLRARAARPAAGRPA